MCAGIQSVCRGRRSQQCQAWRKREVLSIGEPLSVRENKKQREAEKGDDSKAARNLQNRTRAVERD